jgi:hypothetical protein
MTTMATTMELPPITIERDTEDLLITAGAGAVTYLAADTALEFLFLDDTDTPKEYADYYRAGVAAIGAYGVGKLAIGQKGYAKQAAVGAQIALLSVAGNRLLVALDWKNRIERFATPKRFQSTADGGQGHTVRPRPATATSTNPIVARTGYALPAGRARTTQAPDGVRVIFE